ncbi:MAG: 23S rRNA (guanosine(2251)-2'-O)-methyltransferase RlmB [Deltaproteobacteria bacterium]
MRVVYGMNPVKELLRSDAEGLAELWLVEGGERPRAFADMERAARDRGAKVRSAPRARLDRLAGVTQHQGVVAVVADYRYREVEELLAVAAASGRPALLVLLDGVEDPHNLGAVVRSAHALGAHGVILPRDRAAGVTPSVAKASAGAVEHLGIARVTNVVRCLEELKEAGIWTVAAVPDGEQDLASVDLRGPTALVLGGEGQGIRPLVRRTCDHAVRIPMLGRVGSLNASAAAAITLYEVARQRAETAAKRPA